MEIVMDEEMKEFLNKLEEAKEIIGRNQPSMQMEIDTLNEIMKMPPSGKPSKHGIRDFVNKGRKWQPR